jgi:SAM-dependent methyltransferase
MAPPSHPRPPVDPSLLNAGTEEMWTNLGDWRHATAYGAAARALATRVGNAARLRPDDVVVDYACGFGDSLRLWVETFGVRRAVGVEPDPEVCAIVRARIAQWGLASRLAVVTARAEDLAPTDADAAVSAVVCVDAAYHFRTRDDWWRRLVRALPRGARLAASDLALADGQRPRLFTRAVAAAFGIPVANLCDAATIERRLDALGVTARRVDSIGTDVLDGFVAHARGRGAALRLTRSGIRVLRRASRLEYVLVSGEAPGP